ncbi:hypothetical protein AVEN_159497-1 [Araneus ventricosus]|uniref:Uncharacterized protein n=1 Tax=Araneus ventricosus TaxID=182803 RepID=A0A4Y2A190_ARAVE|nr:hypothetical protein AVEN_159497-1 [Araneus ventricosus]
MCRLKILKTLLRNSLSEENLEFLYVAMKSFSTGTAVVRVFSESEKIGWKGPVPYDKLDELSRPVVISKSNFLYGSICGAAINAIIPRLCHLASARCLRSCFALILGRGTVHYVSSNPTQPHVMSVAQRVLNGSGYWAIDMTPLHTSGAYNLKGYLTSWVDEYNNFHHRPLRSYSVR